MQSWIELEDGRFRRRDGYVVHFHFVGQWRAARPDGLALQVRGGVPRSWKTATKAMKAIDREFPYTPRLASLIERHKARLRASLPAVMVGVDAGYPTRYKEQPTKQVIDTALSNGMPVVVLIGRERKLLWPDSLGHLVAGSTPGRTATSPHPGVKVDQPPGF
jgi:hypothetical protein